jgi:hypothetical protein
MVNVTQETNAGRHVLSSNPPEPERDKRAVDSSHTKSIIQIEMLTFFYNMSGLSQAVCAPSVKGRGKGVSIQQSLETFGCV